MAMTSNTVPDQARTPGRPQDPERDIAIIEATLAGLAEVGYDRLSIEGIADRAHIAKTTIYRRWPSKAHLVVDVIAIWRGRLSDSAISPDTGSLIGDVEALVAAVPEFDEKTRGQLAVIVGVVSAAGRDPELMAALAPALARPAQIVATVLDQARMRGELDPARNVDLVPDAVIGLIILQVIRGEPLDRDYISRVMHNVFLPLVSAPPPDVEV